jgi:hypothetical protein
MGNSGCGCDTYCTYDEQGNMIMPSLNIETKIPQPEIPTLGINSNHKASKKTLHTMMKNKSPEERNTYWLRG